MTPLTPSTAPPKDAACQKTKRPRHFHCGFRPRPPTAADFLRHMRFGKMRFTVEFMDSDRHKIGYLKSAWLTRRGLASPESEPLKFRVI